MKSDLTLLSTIKLLERVKIGSEDARNALFERYIPRLRRFARGRLPPGARDLQETDDVVQDVMTKMLHKVDEFDPRHSGAFLAYMRRSVKNRIAEIARRASRQPRNTALEMEIAAPGPSPLQSLLAKGPGKNNFTFWGVEAPA